MQPVSSFTGMLVARLMDRISDEAVQIGIVRYQGETYVVLNCKPPSGELTISRAVPYDKTGCFAADREAESLIKQLNTALTFAERGEKAYLDS